MKDEWSHVKEWLTRCAGRNRRIVIWAITAGFLLTPFLWPFFLGIVYSALRLALPVFLILLGVKMPWRRQNTQGTEKTNGEESQKGTKTDEQKGNNNTDIPKQTKQSAQSGHGAKGQTANAEAAASWYRLTGRDQILHMVKRAEQKGYAMLSIAGDGLCSGRGGKEWRRIGAVRDFHIAYRETVSELVNRENHLSAQVRGSYLRITWSFSGGRKERL